MSCPRSSYEATEEGRLQLLEELLRRKAQTPFYQEGVSNALLKVAELGLTRAAAVLLENGANLHFEGLQRGTVGSAGAGSHNTPLALGSRVQVLLCVPWGKVSCYPPSGGQTWSKAARFLQGGFRHG